MACRRDPWMSVGPPQAPAKKTPGRDASSGAPKPKSRHGLLAHHVLAGLHGSDRDQCVPAGMGGDGNHVDVFPLEHLAEVGVVRLVVAAVFVLHVARGQPADTFAKAPECAAAAAAAADAARNRRRRQPRLSTGTGRPTAWPPRPGSRLRRVRHRPLRSRRR